MDPELATMLAAFIDQIDYIALDTWTEGPVDELGIRLHRARVLQGILHRIDEELEEALIPAMDTDIVGFPGGRLHREETRRSTWTDGEAGERMRDDLAAAVARTIAMDNATGEIDSMKRMVALHTMRTAYEAIPSFSTLLKAGRTRLGLRLGDYRRYDTGYRITIDTEEDDA